MKTVIEDEIKSFVNDVAKRFNPERIILFGSHASGDATPDSDVDILVVMDFKSRPHQQSFEIRRAIKRSFPLDLLVRRPADIDYRLKLGDFFIKEIVREGKVLYEKTRS
ncbi:nucleotidyltransferase domain-containing protein [Thermodesulfovibrionales bacterium]|nr:nucleotidyltransferase domain-containing protein [Thermodesulfovibrionales bacterium]MCL0038525.1 nucleotidyltransferase domain-containing protein [Thermodesulfovibrionales bacterium]MCL0061313.1 nucleotidyltransferase domain-containing protein [Thermodesulfovibrionales bacterium]MCL0066887.1 nucleotidyltransferase domain-containing protein [Thermodesulfovibrionales bacterium]MCL0072491.1 nucleotidyltransferase domain-containing protein [Thermodesulfovibrionales bacterium]